MRRLVVPIALLVALPLVAANDWWPPYERGMKALERQEWAAAAQELKKAIAIEPNENASAVVSGRSRVYLPHYWLGVALDHLGLTDTAVQEWKTSEAQGSIQKTDQYAELRKLLSRAQSAGSAATAEASKGNRAIADAAIKRALSSQVQAMTSGADRSETFRTAKQKLQDAVDAFNKGGDDPDSYFRAGGLATEAEALFVKAAGEAKGRRGTSTAADAAKRTPPATKQAPPSEPVVVDDVGVVIEHTADKTKAPPVETKPESGKTEPEKPAETREPAVELEPSAPVRAEPIEPEPARVEAKAPERNVPPPERDAHVETIVRKEMEAARSAGEVVRRAWTHFAAGDANAAEALMTAVIDRGQSIPEAYLLRGCARYVRAMMSGRDDLADAARRDFIVALQQKPELRLEPKYFSPKLIGYFNQVRSEM